MKPRTKFAVAGTVTFVVLFAAFAFVVPRCSRWVFPETHAAAEPLWAKSLRFRLADVNLRRSFHAPTR